MGKWLASLLLSVVALACVEIDLAIDIGPNGQATVVAKYVIVKELVLGQYAQIENNSLLPLTEDEAREFVQQFSGAQLITASVADEEGYQIYKNRTVGLRKVNLEFFISDINEFHTNHIRLAYYPFKDNSYFQFRIDKAIPENPEVNTATTVNALLEQLAKDRYLKLSAKLPAKVLRSNGAPNGWTKLDWMIPIRAILADPQPSIVAWAEMPGQSGIATSANKFFNQVLTSLPGNDWRDPKNLQPWLLRPTLEPAASP